MGQRINGGASSPKIAGLDGLRGIAILGVVGYHLAPQAVPGGFLGVNLFFVLSGYLIAVSSRRMQVRSGFRVGKFYWKRIIRIYPALILAVCATLFTAQFLAPDVLRGVRHEVLSIFSASNNWWQIVRNTSYFTRITGTSPFTHLWSLAVEMQFYLIWPILFLGYTAPNHRRRWRAGFFILLIFLSVLAMLLLLQPEGDHSRAYYGTDSRIFALLIGGLRGMRPKQLRNSRSGNRLIKTAGFILLLTGFVWLYFVTDSQNILTYWLVFLPSALIASRLIGLCADKSFPFGRRLDCPPLAWLGKRSYELYLVQYPVIFFVLRQPPTGSTLWNTLIAIVLILLIAQWLHQVIALLQTKTRKNLMKKQPYKIGEPVSLLLAGIVMVGGAFAFLTAPDRLASEDQKRLQQELRENAILLEEGISSDYTVPPTPSGTPDDYPAASSPIEDNPQEGTSPAFTGIGDSVMLGAVPELQRVLPGGIIDAEESRQVWDAVSVVRELDGKGGLLDIVVVALGSNGSFSKSSGQELLDALGPERTVCWIAPFGQYLNWQDSTTRILNELAEENKNLTILDWPGTASLHTEWFYDDGMHLNAEGQTGYAAFLQEQLDRTIQNDSITAGIHLY